MKETKHITEGAIMLGIFALLLLMTLFVPFIGILSFLAMAVPFVIYTVRNGWKPGIWLIVLAAILSVLLGTPIALMLSIPASTVGVIIGYCIAKKLNRYAILGAATGVYLLNYILAYVLVIVVFNINFVDLLDEMMRESMEMSVSIATALGQQNADEAMEAFDSALSFTNYLLPFLLVMTAFVHAFFTQLFAIFIVKRLRIEVSPFPPFREIMLPRSLLWYFVAVVLLSLSQPAEGSTLYIVVLNLTFVLSFLLALQGFSFVFFFCYEKKIPKALPIMILIFSFLIPQLLYIIRMIGIVDIGFSLREIIKRKK
ncbi:YybS family protein [Sutcliffiella rhizosphaerae]|uniref:DUF2232 domain-containing protein n=1 Tax=Sutcliffiella rhizosphaerae TaxID=2880967 RepID=A0ABM8YSC0_9BACI|nr:YybS family protein [Sutcliffiella rhizosphaerae]CAG9622898.1 hypothetical protein BACCIP111883_03689 [Sutcliffiella rhizosphaerae]